MESGVSLELAHMCQGLVVASHNVHADKAW